MLHYDSFFSFDSWDSRLREFYGCKLKATFYSSIEYQDQTVLLCESLVSFPPSFSKVTASYFSLLKSIFNGKVASIENKGRNCPKLNKKI